MATCTRRVCVRTTPEEHQLLKERAEKNGFTLSAYGRLLLNADARFVEQSEVGDTLISHPCFYLIHNADIIELSTQIRRFGNQYNQAVFGLNALLKMPYVKKQKIESVVNDISSKIDSIDRNMDEVYVLAKKLEAMRASNQLLFAEGGVH